MYCSNEKIKGSKKMKYFLQENFKKLVCFTLACWINGNPFVVNAFEVNPVDYVIATIIGAGLRDEKIAISFAKMIHQKKKRSRNWYNFLITCWKLICSNESDIHKYFLINNVNHSKIH